MQLLCQTTAADWPRWSRDFAEGAETRGQAGLTVLQIWRAADDATRVLVLLEVSERARAEAWLARQSGLGHGFDATFLETA